MAAVSAAGVRAIEVRHFNKMQRKLNEEGGASGGGGGGPESGKGHDIKIELDERLRRSLGPLGAREMGEG